MRLFQISLLTAPVCRSPPAFGSAASMTPVRGMKSSRIEDSLFDVGLRGEMAEFGQYFKTWNWELGFRYSRNEGQDLSVGEASQPGLREALLDTNPASAFDPFLNFTAHNNAAARPASLRYPS